MPFEVGVLAAAVAGFAALLVLCGLPRLHHPLFDCDAIERGDGRPLFPPGSRASEGGKRQPEGSSLRRESGADRGAAVMRGALVARSLLALCGCTDQSMTKQPHYGPNSPAPVFANGSAAQTPPDGAVAQDAEAYAQASAAPPPVDLALLRRGSERFDIFCAPCHGFEGDGDGAIVRRGFPRPPSYYDAALMARPRATVLRHDHQRLRRDVCLWLPRFPARPLGDHGLYPRPPAEPFDELGAKRRARGRIHERGGSPGRPSARREAASSSRLAAAVLLGGGAHPAAFRRRHGMARRLRLLEFAADRRDCAGPDP